MSRHAPFERFDAAHRLVLKLCHPAGEWELPELGSVDAWAVVELVRRYRCGPLVHVMQRERPADAPCGAPLTTILDACRRDHADLAPRAQAFAATLRDTVCVLLDHGIETIVLKGQALARVLHHDLAYKDMNDVDILVRPELYHRAAEVLANAGYILARGPTWFERRMWVHHWAPLEGPRGVSIDLHWNLAGRHAYRIEPASLWARSVPLDLDGVTARRLSDVDLWTHQVIHFHYYRQRLSDTFDILHAFRLARRTHSRAELADASKEVGAEEALFNTASYCALFSDAPELEALATMVRAPRTFWRREAGNRASQPQCLLTHRGRYFGTLELAIADGLARRGADRLAHLSRAAALAFLPAIPHVRHLENDPSIKNVRPRHYLWHWLRLLYYYRRVV